MNVELIIVSDRSGSMFDIAEDAQGGINAMIKDQATQEGSCKVTLVEFDGEYNIVFSGVEAKDAPEYKLVPRGGTALNDAVGRTMIAVGDRLSNTPPEQRPDRVFFMIVTDGHENASSEFKTSKIKEMIEHQRTKYSWEFIFLGADESAFEVAESMGVSASSSAVYSKEVVHNTYAVVSKKLQNCRSSVEVSMDFSDEERDGIVKH